MSESGALAWRDVVEKHHLALVEELTARLDSGLRDAVSRASEGARRSQAESLNQALRRLRQPKSAEEILQALLDASAAYAGTLVVLTFEKNQARVVAGHGSAGTDVMFGIDSAPAVVSAIETRDPVVALGTAGELSAALAGIFDFQEDGSPPAKVYLFPILSRESVVAMLIASGPDPVLAVLELLGEAAGMRLETLAAPRASDRLGPADTNGRIGGTAAVGKHSWHELTPDDQKLHLQAQRMARVRVAEMRLNNENDLKSGVARNDIYGTLKRPIDAARDQFMQSFVSTSSTMVDYLHLEILHTLAHDNDQLLGEHYPGPMV